MKTIKKSVALFLAVVIALGSFAMLASAEALYNWELDTKFYRMQRNADGYIVDADGNVIADENDVLTEGAVPVWIEADGRAAKGEAVKARVFMKTDFPLGPSSFLFFYPTDFLTHNISTYEKDGATTYKLLTNNDTTNPVGANKFDGTLSVTQSWIDDMIYEGYLSEDDMEGKGWVWAGIDGASGGTITLDGNDWLFEFNFTVNSNAADVGQFYLSAECIADWDNWLACTIISAGLDGEGGNFNDNEDSTITDTGTFGYTLKDTDEDSSLSFTTATLTFDANGGTFADGSATKSETTDIKPTKAATLPENPSIAGGEFLGWVNADVEEPTEDDILDAANIKYGYYDVTYKALYRLENSAKIIINYTDAVTGEAKTVEKLVASKTDYTVKLVENVPAVEDQEPNTTYVAFADLTAVEHYAFDAANASNEFEVVVADDGSSVMNVYYAPVDYTATFNPDNGDEATTVTEAYWTEITAPAAPSKSGMKFTGWKLEGTDTVIAAGAKFNLAGNVSYKAQYESAETTVAVKVKYYDLANGGAETFVDVKTVETIVGYTVALVEVAGDAENTAYVLTSELPAIEHYEYDAANTVTTVTATEGGSSVLTVAYKPVKYTATFAGAETFADVDYYTEITAPAGPASAGQTFTGWKLEGTDEVIKAGDKFNIDSNVDYTPVYDDIIYNTAFTFNGEEGVDYPEDIVLNNKTTGIMGEPIDLADPEPVTGWNFLGWDTPVGAVEKDGKYYYGTSNVTVTGNWEHVEYTITYWLDEAMTEVYDYQYYYYGDLIELFDAPPADLMPAGKSFIEWDTDLITMPAEDVDITPLTEDIIYQVRINVNGQIVDTLEDYTYGTKIYEEELEKYKPDEGYTFENWKWKDRNGNEISFPYEVKGTVTIFAVADIIKSDIYFWETEEDYNAYDSGDTSVTPVLLVEDIEFEADISSYTPVAPDREGYTFRFWNMDPSTMEAEDMHFWGIWKVNTYTVTWDNEGEKTEVPYEYGATINKLADPEDKTGYTFGGWSLYEDGMKMPANDVTFTAIWNADTFDAVFYVDGNVYATVPTEFGADIVLPKEPVKAGYFFAGWTPSVGKMDAEGKTFNAQWTVKGDTPYTVNVYTMGTDGAYVLDDKHFTAATDSTVTYNPEIAEGFELRADSETSGIVSAEKELVLNIWIDRKTYTLTTVVDGKTVKTPYLYGAAVSVATPTKEGHSFAWDKAVPATMPAKDETLNGTFTALQYDLIYMVDGKQYSAEKVTYGTNVTVIAPLTQEGYNFSGWSKTGTFAMPAETVTISGSFAVNSYNVIYKVDGNVVHEATAEYNSKVDLYDYTPAEGYNFSGWDKVDGFTMPAEDVTVNGTTSLITVTITYDFTGDVPADYPEPAPVPATYGESVSKYTNYGGSDLVTGYASTLFGVRGAVHDDATGEYYVGTDDITIIYAWNRIPVRTTTNYTGDVPAGYESTEDFSKSYNDTFTLTTPAEEGYTFKGWTVEGAAEYDAATGTVKVGTAAITITGAWEINKHDVIYMVDGVEYARVEDVAYGTPVTVLDDLVEAGKDFSGWDKTDFTMPDEDVVINGSWTSISYTVTYYTNKEMTETLRVFEGISGTEYNIPSISKTGYEFLGWFNADGTPANLPVAGTIVTIPVDGAVYYADWQVKKFDLVYNAGSGAKFADGKSMVTFSTEFGTAKADWSKPDSDPTKPGYTFGGWNLDAAPATMPESKQVITAIWNPINYTVTWIDGEEEVEENYIYGETILAPIMEKEGWTFLGWLEADGETYFADGDVMGEKSLVYTAQWEGEDGIEYTVYKYFEKLDKSGWETAQTEVLTGKAGSTASVTAEDEAVEGFYIDGENSVFSAEIAGDGSTKLVIYYYRNIVNVTVKDPEGETYIDGEFTFGEEIALAKPEKEGFTFVEWQDGKGNVVTFPLNAPADDIVIKPIWSANEYTITFVDEDGTVIEAAKKLAFGSAIVAPAAPEKDGYKFAYWRDAETKAVMPTTMPAMNVTYETFYTAGEDTTYYIEVYMMDTNGDYTMASQTVATGTTGDPISITPGNVEGCTYDADKSVLTGVITADGKATLEIYYSRKLLNVTFKSGEGTFADGTKEIVKDVYFGAAIPVPAQPTRAGYDFAGWNNEVPATMPADNLTFTATWAEAEYTITYVVNDKIEEVKTYKFGEAVETPATPNVAGMTFKNWSMEIPATMPAEDLIIIAVFEISVYEVRYYVDGVVFQQYSVAHGDEIPVPADVPTKKYHTFKGWTEIPATMPAQNVEIHAIFERDAIELVPMDGSTTVIDNEKMAIYGLDIYLVEKDLRESFLKVNGDGDFRVIASKGTACGTGTVIELYDNANPEETIKTYTIVIFGDINGDANITTTDYTLAQAEYDMLTFWSDPMDESYNPYKTMAADLNGDGIISVKEPASIHRYVLSAVDIDQTNGDVIQCF